MLKGWEIAEASKQRAAEFEMKCDWCAKRGITHFVVDSEQVLSRVCGHCYRKMNVKEITEAAIVKKKPYRWAGGSKRKERVVFKSQ